MKKTLFQSIIFLTAFYGFSQEEEKVVKVAVVKDSSLEATYPKGDNEIRLNALSFLVVEDINIFYEKILYDTTPDSRQNTF